MIALRYDGSKTAHLLFNHECHDININGRDIDSETALTLATAPAHSYLEMLLADPRVDLNLGNKNGKTTLAIVHECQYLDVAQMLIDADASELRTSKRKFWKTKLS